MPDTLLGTFVIYCVFGQKQSVFLNDFKIIEILLIFVIFSIILEIKDYKMTEKLIQRPEYLEKLKKWSKDISMIKIITGVRRCGKSKLLVLFEQYLVESGVDKSLIHKNRPRFIGKCGIIGPCEII